MATGAASPRVLAVVGAGGALGTALRFAVGQITGSTAAATLMVNLCGALLLGFLLGWAPRTTPEADRRAAMRAFFGTGMLGGFTTYSALALEIVEQPTWQGMGYGVLTVVAGVGLAVCGILLGRRVPR